MFQAHLKRLDEQTERLENCIHRIGMLGDTLLGPTLKSSEGSPEAPVEVNSIHNALKTRILHHDELLADMTIAIERLEEAVLGKDTSPTGGRVGG